MNRERAKGASRSLETTINEIVEFLQQERGRRHGKLRPFLHEKLADLAEKWLKRGFNRGHQESYSSFKKKKPFPRVIHYEGYRELFTDQHRRVQLTSRLKPKAPDGR